MLHNQVSKMPIIIQNNNNIFLLTGQPGTSIFFRQGCGHPADCFQQTLTEYNKALIEQLLTHATIITSLIKHGVDHTRKIISEEE